MTGQNRAVEGTGETFNAYDSITVTGTNNSLTINDTIGASAAGVPTGVSISGVQFADIYSTGSIGRAASGTTAAQTQVLTYTASTNTATSTITAGGVSVTATSGATDVTGAASATAAVTALTAIYNSLGYTVITSGTPADATEILIERSTGVVTVTSFEGVAVPFAAVTTASNATQLPAIANTAATTAVSAVTYDVSDWDGLESFVGESGGSIALLAADTTELDLVANGAVTVNGGAGDSFIVSAGAVSIGADTTVANAFTSLTLDGSSTTVDITDNSGTLSDGVTVAVGSTLKTVSIAGKTGTATLTGNGITSVNLETSAGDVTVTNTTAGHSMALGLIGVSSGTFTDANATSLAITTGASSSASTVNTLTGLTVAKVAAMTVGGTKSVDLGTISATKLATVTITGTGGVTADVSSAGATTTAGFVTSVDTTGSSAVLSTANGTKANNITIGTSTTFTGGSGTDNVTVGASTKAITLGGGNDKLVLTAAAPGTGGTVDGGTGTDTVEMSLTNAVTAGSSSGTLNAKISNFEKLSITSAATGGSDKTVDFGYLSQVNSYVKLAAVTGGSSSSVILNNLANNATVEISGDTAASTGITASINDAAYSTTNTLNLALTTTDELRVARTVTANSIENINIILSNTDSTPVARLSTMTLSADAVKTIVVSGNMGLVLTNTSTTVTSVDASGITSVTQSDGTVAKNAFTWTAGALTSTANTPITVVGTSSGTNTISLENVTNGLINSTISVGTNASSNSLTGGAGIDTMTGGSGNDTFTGGGNRDVITTGAGNDVIVFATSAASRDRVTDFTAGSGGQADTIKTANYSASADFFTATAAAASFEFNVADTGTVIEFAFAANSAVSLGDGSANSLNGTNLLLGLYDGNTAATLAVASGDADTDVEYLAAYQDGKAYIYKVGSVSSGVEITADEITLVGILDNVAVGALTSANFAA